jgi:hypothetical protein
MPILVEPIRGLVINGTSRLGIRTVPAYLHLVMLYFVMKYSDVFELGEFFLVIALPILCPN